MSLTKSDLDKLKSIFDLKISGLEKSLDLKISGLEKTVDLKINGLESSLSEKISHLPTKEEFFMAMDKWMKATSTADIERPLHRREHDEIRKFLELHRS